MTPIIFLDIDGVLNCSALNMSKEMFNAINDVGTRYGRLSSSRIKNLNSLISDTGAEIVLSSTWRSSENVNGVLYDAGINGKIVSHTPFLREEGSLRGNEIYVWIQKHIAYQQRDNFKYVIIDDDSDMLYWQRNNFLLCDRECGLSQDIAYKAARILNGIY